MTKHIQYDRETHDFILTLDGEFVGYAATYADGERILDELVYERLRRQSAGTTEAQRDAAPLATPRRVAPNSILNEDDAPTPEPTPTPAPAATARPIPSRVASPARIADAVSVAFARVEHLPDAERGKHERAIEKAFTQLLAGVIPTRSGNGLVWPSRSRKGAVQHVTAHGVCSCEASGVCWHLKAEEIVELLYDVAIDDEYAAYEFAA